MGFPADTIFGVGRPAGIEFQVMQGEPQYRAECALLPHQPLHGVPVVDRIRGQEAAAFFGQVHQNCATLEDRNAGVLIDNRRHPVVGRDFKKLRSKLIAGAYPHRDDVVRQLALFEHYRNFAAIWRWPVVKIYHVLQYKVLT